MFELQCHGVTEISVERREFEKTSASDAFVTTAITIYTKDGDRFVVTMYSDAGTDLFGAIENGTEQV